jgi:hypothetical protein
MFEFMQFKPGTCDKQLIKNQNGDSLIKEYLGLFNKPVDVL